MVREGYPKDWKRIVKRILERDGWTCSWCGQDLREHGVTPSVDHVVSLKDGRREGWTDAQLHDPSNLAAACRSCNSSRRGYGPPKRIDNRKKIESLFFEANYRPRAAGLGVYPSEVDKPRGQRWKLQPGGHE